MTRTRRLSPQTVAVLTALATDPSAWRHGYELGREVGLKAGSLYPILIRLCDRGLLEATWEADPPPGRPARHLYRLTGDGVLAAEQNAGDEARGRRPHGELRGAWRDGGLRGASRDGGLRSASRDGDLRGTWRDGDLRGAS